MHSSAALICALVQSAEVEQNFDSVHSVKISEAPRVYGPQQALLSSRIEDPGACTPLWPQAAGKSFTKARIQALMHALGWTITLRQLLGIAKS